MYTAEMLASPRCTPRAEMHTVHALVHNEQASSSAGSAFFLIKPIRATTGMADAISDAEFRDLSVADVLRFTRRWDMWHTCLMHMHTCIHVHVSVRAWLAALCVGMRACACTCLVAGAHTSSRSP